MTNNTRLRCSRILTGLAAASALTLAVVTNVARADDIDTYSNPPGITGRPNVLFILDNTANWSSTISKNDKCSEPKANVARTEEGTKMGAEKCALYRLIDAMSVSDLSQYNLAFMLFNESPYSSGYPRQAFINIQTQSDKNALLQMISNLDILKDKGNNAATAETFYEAWLWFRGDQVRLGNKTITKNDVRAFTNSSRTTYLGPGINCAKNHIIYLANGSPQDNNTVTEQLLKSINPSYKRIRIPIAEGVGTNDEANWADEFAAFFNNGADLSSTYDGQQTIQVHTIAVTGAPSDGNYPNYIRWIAEMGGGLYQEARSADTIIGAVKDALNQIRASNSVFSSAALPVSANTQGAYLNQVFIGMFRPDGNALERWVGNLKQYQFKYDAQLDTLQLADSLNNPAVSTTTGFIASTAVSFWTQASSYWINAELTSTGKITRSDSPDGDLVEKGGAAQWLRTTYPTLADRDKRPVYTCIDTCSGNIDLAAGGTSYQFSRDNSSLKNLFQKLVGSNDQLLIDWVRGEENVTKSNVTDFDAAKDQLETPPLKDTTLTPPINVDNTVRPSIHGDVLHSRPVALNYGGTRGVVVYYGANDGMLRAVNGNQTGTGAGSELWAFVAPEHFPTLNRLRENTPEVLYPSTPPTNTTARKRDYFFDGPIGAYQNTSSGEVLIFPTMRRGGSAVYGFDVTDPDSPRLMWSFSPSKMTGYTGLGQTWSTPRVARVKRTDGGTDPFLVMGGGFDNDAEDSVTPGTTTKGKGVYVFNMRTGERLARLVGIDMESVPSDVALIDTDGDGFVDRGYVIDVRANVYRIDMESAAGDARDPSNWVITKIANFNDAAGSRRVFFAPDVVLTKNYTLLMLGTGDREKPLKSVTNDRFYIIKDRKVTKGEPTSVTLLTDDSPKMVPMSNDAAASDPDGCYLEMAKDGEKVINQPVTFGGITYFSTAKPSTAALTCSTTKSKAYQVPLLCRSATSVELLGDGLPPSPVAGYVEVGDKVVPFVIGGGNNKKSAIEVNRPQLSVPGNRHRSYWFINNRDR